MQFAGVIAVVAVFLFAAWRSAALRGVLEQLDRRLVAGLYAALGLLVVVPLVLLLTGRRWSTPWASRPGLRRALSRAAGPAGLAGSMVIFVIPVFAAWHRGRAFSMIGGAVPWGDAHLYAGGAERLLFFDDLDGFNSRRPINAVYLALRLAIGRLDLRVAVLIGVLVLGVATFVAARAVARDLGATAGASMFVGVFGFIHYYLPTTLSETFGVTVGMLAFATLWNAARYRSRWLTVGGIFLLAIALGVRTGVFMLAALMALWLARRLRASGRLDLRLLGASALAMAVGVSLTFVAVIGLGGDRTNTFGNGGLLLYGMAKGHAAWDAVDVAWAVAYADHPEIIPMTDGQRNRFVNRLAREEIAAHPTRFLRTTLESEGNYLRMAKRVILASWSVRLHRALMVGAALAIAAALAVRLRRGRDRRVWADLALLGCTVLAVPALMSITPGLVPPRWVPPALVAGAFVAFLVVGTASVPRPFPVPMTLAAFVAVVMSLPFIGTDAVRVFADGIPFMTLPLVLAVVVLGRVSRRELDPSPDPDKETEEPAAAPAWRPTSVGALPAVVGGALVATMALGIPIALAVVDPPEVGARRCPDGQPAQPLFGGVAVRIVPDPTGGGRAVDEVGLDAFSYQAPAYAPSPYLHLARITGPATLIGGVTPEGVDRFAIVDDQVGAPRTSVLYLCGQVERDPVTDVVFSVLTNPADVFRGVPLEDGGS